MPDGPCVYCLDPKVNVAICLGCKAKLDQARKDVECYKRMATRERSGFFRLSRENQRLREHLAKLENEGRKKT